jgi:hypothetical protein
MKLQPQGLQKITTVEGLPTTSLLVRPMHEMPTTFRSCPGFETSEVMKQFVQSPNHIKFAFLIEAFLRDGTWLLTPPRTMGSVRWFGLQYRSNTSPAWNAVCDLGDGGGDDERAESGYLGAAID